jgi:hypothetical protein
VLDFAGQVVERFGPPAMLVNAAGPCYIRTMSMVRVTSAYLPAWAEAAVPSLSLNVAAGGSGSLAGFSGSLCGFRSVAAALERALDDSWVTVQTTMPDEIERVLQIATLAMQIGRPHVGSRRAAAGRAASSQA